MRVGKRKLLRELLSLRLRNHRRDSATCRRRDEAQPESAANNLQQRYSSQPQPHSCVAARIRCASFVGIACCWRAKHDRALYRDHLDVREQIEVFVILVFTALAEADGLLRFDEFNPLDPLHHFVTKLVFNPQPQWSAIHFGQRLAIHL